MLHRSRHRPDAAVRERLREAAATVTADAPETGEPVARALRRTRRRLVDGPTHRRFTRIEKERRRLTRDRAELSGGRGTTSTVGDVTRQASVPRHQAALLYHLARETGAVRVLEMGTCVGVSGAYLAAGVADHEGTLTSLEGYADRAEVAREAWRRLGLEHAEVVVGRFQHTLDEVLGSGPFDLAFVDGHHDGTATIDYTHRIRRTSRPGTVLVLDDIDWSSDMRTAWQHLRGRLRASVTCDLHRVGLILLGEGDTGPD